MSIVGIMLGHLESTSASQSQLTAGQYRLQMAAGRSNSICFTLEQSSPNGASIVLAEGFSLDGRLIFDQARLPTQQVEVIIREIVPQTCGPSVTHRMLTDASSPIPAGEG
jgi:hypothetical protein